MNKRKRYTNEEKMNVLHEFSTSKNAKMAFEKINVHINLISNDKKYASKLISKWKKELYKNKNSNSNINLFFNKKDMQNDINKKDFIMEYYIELQKNNNFS